MKITNLLIIIFYTFVYFINIYSQWGAHPVPLHKGNIWFYMYNYQGYIEHFILELEDTTVIFKGKEYYSLKGINYPAYSYFRLKEDSFYIGRSSSFEDSTMEFPYYKKGAKIGDIWSHKDIFWPQSDEIYYHEVVDTGYTFLGTMDIPIKIIRIYVENFLGSEETVLYAVQWWSEDFGLIYASEYDAGSFELIGCQIDGKKYGDTTFVTVENEEIIPNEFILYQNYPNPFNSSTKIEFYIPERSYVQLKIYDVLGRYITTLVDKEITNGKYSIPFNANNLASGLYIYELRVNGTSRFYRDGTFRSYWDNLVQRKKMLLLK